MLYRGTRFAPGSTPPQPGAAQARRTKGMMARLGRRRRFARGRRAATAAGDAEGADALQEFEVVGDECEHRYGGGRGREDSRDGQHDAPDATPAITFKAGQRLPVIAPAAHRDAHSLPPVDPAADPAMLRDQCTRELLDLLTDSNAQPDARRAAHIHAWSERWLGLQQTGVTLLESSLEMLRAHAVPRPSETNGTPRLPDAARHVNLLAGLLLRQFDRPRTPRQCACALDTLRLLQP
ncbi:hypothetical protein [Burkholderia lata]|uniref:hypothetical protein n=1 Tax=Burkholderia lata (strain ATCC 17760 / DSM 23089 / LMG 22485 / NCIMB 9086 / R18194 / 383) TaxID=482957 RepID=UPI001583E2AF|nr:hypothetical protein [Burkholderia lata]